MVLLEVIYEKTGCSIYRQNTVYHLSNMQSIYNLVSGRGKMSCFHPMKGFPVGRDAKLKITPFNVVGVDYKGNYYYSKRYDSNEEICYDYFEIPCGHCEGCRMDQAKEWSNRLIMESQYWDSMYFVTLTYNEMNLRRVNYVDELTGEIKADRGTLSKKDVQLFIKRLRKARPDDKLRYYLCGEYGPTTDRPHYHAIIYGLHIGDWHLLESGHSETGNTYYTCSELERIWGNGFVSIEPANEFTCKYVAQYVTKKIGAGSGERRRERGQQPEFSLSSKRPAIGRRYYEDNMDRIFSEDKIFLPTEQGSVEVRPPRYFKKLYRESHEDKYSELVQRHLQAAADSEDAKTTVTDKDKLGQLEAKEKDLKSKINIRNKL